MRNPTSCAPGGGKRTERQPFIQCILVVVCIALFAVAVLVETLDFGALFYVIGILYEYILFGPIFLNDGALRLSNFPIQQKWSLCNAGICQVNNPAI